MTNAKKYSIRWWFLNGVHAAQEGYSLSRTAKSYMAHLAYVAGYKLYTA